MGGQVSLNGPCVRRRLISGFEFLKPSSHRQERTLLRVNRHWMSWNMQWSSWKKLPNSTREKVPCSRRRVDMNWKRPSWMGGVARAVPRVFSQRFAIRFVSLAESWINHLMYFSLARQRNNLVATWSRFRTIGSIRSSEEHSGPSGSKPHRKRMPEGLQQSVRWRWISTGTWRRRLRLAVEPVNHLVASAIRR